MTIENRNEELAAILGYMIKDKDVDIPLDKMNMFLKNLNNKNIKITVNDTTINVSLVYDKSRGKDAT